jgi:hypothetical protein
MPDADPRPLVEWLSPSKRQALFSLYRYFEWADDMRRMYLHLLSESPIGQKRAAGVTAEEAFELAKADPAFKQSVVSVLYAFPYMAYYYAGMFVVIEAWTGRLKYHDPEIDDLLRSRFVATLKEYRNASFHFSPQYFDSRMQVFLNEPDSEVWLGDLHAAFARWFRFHLKLRPHEGPGRSQ